MLDKIRDLLGTVLLGKELMSQVGRIREFLEMADEVATVVSPLEIDVELCDPNAKCPQYGTSGAGAFDFYSPTFGTIGAGQSAVIDLGLKMVIPKGYMLLLWSRSGMAANFGLEKGAGLIDDDYRGPIKLVLRNHGKEPYSYNVGDKLVQGFLVRKRGTNFRMVNKVENDTERGEGGFGSTGA